MHFKIQSLLFGKRAIEPVHSFVTLTCDEGGKRRRRKKRSATEKWWFNFFFVSFFLVFVVVHVAEEGLHSRGQLSD